MTLSTKIKFFQTVITWGLFFVVGSHMASLGPSLLDLQIAVNGTLEETAFVLPANALGIGIGSIIIDYALRLGRYEYIFGIALMLFSAFWTCAPLSPSIVLLCFCIFSSGLSVGILTVGSATYTLEIWKEKASVMIQLNEMILGVGALITPVFLEPFLLPNENMVNGVIIATGNSSDDTEAYTSSDVEIQIPYSILSLLMLILGIMCIAVGKYAETDVTTITEEEKKPLMDKPEPNKRQKIIVIILATVGLHLYFGLEMIYGEMLVPHLVVGKAKLSKSMAAYGNSAFWATFTFSRLLPTAFSNYISVTTCIVIECLMVLAADLLLLIDGVSQISIWTSIVVMGFGLSAIFGQIIAYVNDHIKVTNTSMSLFIISSTVAESIYPVIIGQYLNSSLDIFNILASGCTLGMILAFSVLFIYIRRLNTSIRCN